MMFLQPGWVREDEDEEMSSAVKKRKAKADEEARALAESANEKHQYFCEFCRKVAITHTNRTLTTH